MIDVSFTDALIGILGTLLTYATLKNKIVTNSLEIEKYSAESGLITLLREQIEILKHDNKQLGTESDNSSQSADSCVIELIRYKELCSNLESKIQIQDGVIQHLSDVLKQTRDSINNL